jgi:hypothetical protein
MKPTKITLQKVLYIPKCGKNNLLSITQLIKKRAKFDFTPGGTTISIGSTVVCHASINNGLFMFRAMSSVPISTLTSPMVLASSLEGQGGGRYNIFKHSGCGRPQTYSHMAYLARTSLPPGDQKASKYGFGRPVALQAPFEMCM